MFGPADNAANEFGNAVENIILGREPRDREQVAQFLNPANFGGGTHARFQALDIKVEGRARVFDNLFVAHFGALL